MDPGDAGCDLKGKQAVEMAAVLGELREISRAFREDTDQLDRFITQFAALRDLIEVTSRIADIKELLKIVLEKGMGTTGAKFGTVMLLRETGDGLEIVATEGWTPSVVGPINPKESLAGKVIEAGEPLLVADIEEREDLARENDSSRYSSPSFLIVPLRAKSAVIGAVCFSEKANRESFTVHDLEFLEVLLGQVGFAIENARLLKQARDTARSLSETVENQRLQIRQAQQQSFHAEKLSSMGQMIAGVAHELNTPLTAILGNSELLLKQKEEGGELDDGSYRQVLQSVFDEAQRAKHIVLNLLGFARQRKSQRDAADLNHIVDNIVNLRRYELRNRDIDLSTDLAADLPLTMADADGLQQVVLNLLNNSVEAMSSKGPRTIRVATRCVGGNLILRVSDTGRGISKSVFDRVFDPFFSTKPGKTHSGLGLTLSRQIVREHDGDIRLESVEGSGTLVEVSFPLATPSTSKEACGEPPRLDFSRFQKQLALVVDDEASNADLIARILRTAGFRVDVTNSGVEALQRMRYEHFCLIVCDLLMPEMDGKTLYQEALKLVPEMANRFLFTTGDLADARIHQVARNGTVRLLAKPFTRQELLEAVAATLDK